MMSVSPRNSKFIIAVRVCSSLVRTYVLYMVYHLGLYGQSVIRFFINTDVKKAVIKKLRIILALSVLFHMGSVILCFILWY